MSLYLAHQPIQSCGDDYMRTGTPEELAPNRADLTDALNVLADKYQFDASGATASEWVTRLDDNDFFSDLSFAEKREIVRFIAQSNCVALRHCRDRLVDTLEEIVTES